MIIAPKDYVKFRIRARRLLRKTFFGVWGLLYETARHVLVGMLISVFLVPLSLWGNPVGGQVVAGDATISSVGTTTTINQSTSHAIVHWQDFSVNTGETTQFVQPSVSAATLNRVTGANPSLIYGTLKANGTVFLINQNGVLVGASGVIETGGFVASTLDIADADFMSGGDIQFIGDSAYKVVNEGSIKGLTGDIVLIAREVENRGTLNAENGQVLLGAGTEVLLMDPSGSDTAVRVVGLGSIDNEGLIEAVEAELKAAGGSMYELAINQTGVIEASGSVVKDGRVILSAEEGHVSVAGTIDASATETGRHGGTVHILGDEVTVKADTVVDVSGDIGGGTALVGGDYQGNNPDIKNAQFTTVEEGVLFKADSFSYGNAGKVIFWADDTTEYYGHVSGQAFGSSGDGGFVEVSGKNILRFDGTVNLRAENGGWGTLLLDPTDVVIENSNSGSVGDATVGDSVIITALGSANVTIQADETITLNGTADSLGAIDITWSNNTTLTLDAGDDILGNAGAQINSTNSGSNFTAIVMEANLDGGTGNFSGIDLNDVDVTAVSGNITLEGEGGDTASDRGIRIRQGTVIETTGTDGNAGNITITGTGGSETGTATEAIQFANTSVVRTDAGSITLIANEGGGDEGIHLNGSSSIGDSSTSGNIVLEADYMNIQGTVDGTGNLFIRGLANGTSIGLGDSATGTLNLDEAEIGNLSNGFNEILFGRTGGTSTLRLDSTITFNDPVAFRMGGTGGAIQVNAAPTFSGTDTAEFRGTSVTVGAAIAMGSGNLTLRADTLALNAAVSGTGTIFIVPESSSTTMGIGASATGTLNVDATELGNITNGWSLISLGETTRTTEIDLNSETFTDPVSIQNAANNDIIIGSGETINTTGSNKEITIHAGRELEIDGTVQTVNSDIDLRGNDDGAGSALGSTGGFRGVDVDTGTVTTVEGDITIIGHAGDTGGSQQGIRVNTNGTVSSTGTGSGAGTITMTGVGGTGSATTGAVGININGTITSVDGDILLTGTGGGTGATAQQGILINNTVSSTGTGANAANITLIGTGGSSATGESAGVDLNPNDTLSVVDGNLTITGTAGEGTSDGINLEAAVGTGSTTGDFTFNTDGIVDFGGAVQSSGTLVIQPITASTAIGIGTGAAGALTMDDTTLSNLTAGFSSITIGLSTGTGLVDVQAWNPNDSTIIQSWGDGGTIDVDGSIALSGSDTLTLRAGGEINIDGGNTISVVNGDLEIRGNADAVGDIIGTSGALGVDIVTTGTTITTSGTGNITIIGNGGTSQGVRLLNGATISSTSTSASAGTITITGESIDNSNIGVNLNPGTVTSVNGNISITGTADATTSNDPGARIQGASLISSTGTGANAATITIVGTSGNGASSAANGITFAGSASTTSVDGDISITGSTLGTASGADGFSMTSTGGITTTGTGSNAGNITIDGSGNALTAGSRGILISNASSNVDTVDGDITLVGSAGSGTEAIAVTNGTVGTGSTTGDITFTASGIIDLDNTVQSSGSLVIQPTGFGNNIGLGDGASGNLLFDSTSATNLSGFSDVTIGYTFGTGNIDVETIVFTSPVTIQSYAANGNIDIDGALSTTGSNSISIFAGEAFLMNATGSITTVSGDITIYGNDDGAGARIDSSMSNPYTTGFSIESGGLLTTTSGAMDLRGGGEDGGDDRYGINVDGTISSTGTGGSVGAITLVGTAFYDQSDSHYGIDVDGTISVVDADLTLTGTGGDAGSSFGLNIQGTVTSTGTGGNAGTITLDGTATNSGSSADGVRIDGGTVRSTEGAIVITGTTPTTAAQEVSTASSGAIGDGTTTADITINANTIELGTGTNIQSTGNLNIIPRTASTTIGLGNSATGTLNLDATEIGYFADGFNSIVIGSATGSGNIEVQTVAFTDDVTLRAEDGDGDIDVAGDLSTTGSANLTITSGGAFAINSTGSITTVSGDITIYGNEDGTGSVDTSSYGFEVASGGLLTTTSGAMDLRGGGGSGTDDRYGVSITGTVSSTGTGGSVGTVTILGTGYYDQSGGHHGVYIDGVGAISVVDGNLSITGTGGDTSNSQGIEMGGTITSTGTGSNAGTITLVGTTDVSGTVEGVNIVGTGSITSVDGDISITGTSSGDGTGGARGVTLVSTGGITSTGTGANAANISITGIGSTNATVNADGILLNNSSFNLTTVDGDITIDGTAGTGTSADAFQISSSGVLGDATTDGTITITGAGNVNLSAGSSIQGSGSLVFVPDAVSDTLGIGDSATGSLLVLDNTVTNLVDGFSDITFGYSTGTGHINVQASSFDDPVIIQSWADGGTIDVDGTLATTGSNNLSLRAGGEITATSLGRINVVDGDLDIRGNADAVGDPIAASGSFDGVDLDGGDGSVMIETSGTGNITIIGNAGPTSGVGVLIREAEAIQSTATGASAGTITITGTSPSSRGIQMDPAVITSVDGDITITATSNSTTNSEGMEIRSSSSITSTGTGANAANITLIGTSGTGTSSDATGMAVDMSGNISAVDGDIAITGTSRTTGSGAAGVEIKGSGGIITTGDGNITITGTGSTAVGAGSSNGIEITDSSMNINTDSGNITFIATAGTGGDGISYDSGEIGDAGTTGTITFRTDGIVDLNDVTDPVTSSGALIIEPLTASTNIGVGTTSTGDLFIDDTSLSNLADGFSSITIGSATGTGHVDVEAWSPNDPTTIQAYGVGGSVDVDGNLTMSGSDSLTLLAGEQFDMVGTATISVVNGNLTIRGNEDGAGSAITTTGGFHGTQIIGVVTTSGTGDIAIYGIGGNTANDRGVRVQSGTGTVSSTATGASAGTITIVGIGGPSTDNANIGFDLITDGSSITSVDGDISITGTGDSTGGVTNYGINLTNNTVISSTGTGANAANITIVGVGGNANSTGGNTGVRIQSDATGAITSVDGDIDITGTAGTLSGSASVNVGVHFSDPIRTTGDGNITITGTGATGTTSTMAGIGVFSGGSIDATGTGSITLIGTAASGTDVGIDVSAGTVGSGSTSGTITLRSDEDVNLDAAVTGTGNLVIEPITASTSIAVGSTATGTLLVDDTSLGNITDGFSLITIGSTTGTGAVDVEAWTPSDSVLIQSWGDGGSMTVDGNVTMSGSDSLTLRTGGLIDIDDDSVLTVVNGNLEIRGNADAGGDYISTSNTFGVDIGSASTTLTTTGTGDIIIFGNGQNSQGVRLLNGATISSTATGASAGTITITANTANNHGINLNPGTITSVDGDITITATSTGTTTATEGMRLISTTSITSTGTGANAANITLVGTSGAGNDSNAEGVDIGDSTLITAADGDIAITGTSVGTASGVEGVLVTTTGGITTSGDGNITITGTGSTAGGADFSHGILITNASANIDTVSGDITLTGTAGTNGDAIALASGTIGTGSTAGDVTLTGTGTIDLDSTVQGTGSFIVQPVGTSDTLGIGDGATGSLVFDTTSATNLSTFTTATFGYATGTGAIDVETAVFSLPTIIQSWGVGGTIDVDAALSTTGSNNLTLRSGQAFTVSSSGSITTVSGDLEIRGNADGSGDAISTGDFDGVDFAGDITTTDGAVTVIGRGGNVGGDGIRMIDSDMLLQSTGTGGSVGTWNFTGTAESGTGNDSGINYTQGEIRTVDADINLTGTTSASGSTVRGVNILTSSELRTTGTGANAGNITLTGTGSQNHSGFGSDGIVISGSGAEVDTVDGDITLIGTAGAGSSPLGVLMSSDGTLGGASTTGTITIRSDDTIQMSDVIAIQSSGALVIEPITSSSDIGVGSGSTGDLVISSLELTDGFSGITIGLATGTGDIDIETFAFTDNVTIQSYGVDGSIDIDGALSTTGSANLTLFAGEQFIVSSTGSVTTVSGDILIRGNDDGLGARIDTFILGTGGININSGGLVTTTSGTITMTGRGDDGGDDRVGTVIAGTVSSTGTGGSIGAIDITGVATYDSSDGHDGLRVDSGTVSTVDGNIILTGTGGGGSGGSDGVSIDGTGSVTSTGTGGNAGTITITGTATDATASSSHGVNINAGIIRSTEGAISITGTAADSSASDFSMSGSTPELGDGTTTADITINANSVALGTGSNLQSTGDLSFTPRTVSTTIGIGNSSTGTLNLDATEVGYFASGFNLITIGSASGTGAVDIETAAFTSPTTIQSYGVGGFVDVDGALSTTGSNALNLYAGQEFELSTGGSIAVVDGALTIRGNDDGGGTAVTTTGDFVGVDLNAGTITTSGTGNVVIRGIGGDTDFDHGIDLSSTTISSTSTGASAGTITIIGDTDTSAGSGIGIDMGGSATITSVDGDISLTGTSRGPGTTSPRGVSLTSTGGITSTGTGANAANITITGTGSSLGTTNADGVLLNNASFTFTTVDGDITIDGTEGAGTNSGAFEIFSSSVLGSATTAGTITITGTGEVGAVGTIQGSGSLVFRPATTSDTLGIGTTATGSLLVQDTIVNNLADGFSDITFGYATGTGHVDVETAAFTDPVTIQSYGNGGTIDVDGDLSTNGSNALNLYAGEQFDLSTGGSIVVVDGNLTIRGNDDGAGNTVSTGDNFIGVDVKDSITTSGTGNIVIRGIGGDTGGSNEGVSLSASATLIESTATGASAGTITLIGKGGASTSDFARGVEINGSSSITSVDGDISITGTGDDSGGTGNRKHGVRIGASGTTISSTGTGANAANITIVGVGGPQTTSGDEHGVSTGSGATINTVDGDISITGTAGGTTAASDASGIRLGIPITATGTGSITLTGTGATSAGGDQSGVYFFDAAADITTDSGNITIVGTAGSGGTEGIETVTGSSIGDGSTTGTITLRSDNTIDLNVAAQSSGALVVEPITASTNIGIGDSAAGTLLLDDTSLGNLTDGFSSITIGLATGTGDVDVEAWSPTDSLTIQSYGAGGTIDIDGALAMSGSDTLTLRAGQTVEVSAGSLAVVNGDLTILGNDDGGGTEITTGSEFTGVVIGGNITTSGTGNIDIDGLAGTSGVNITGVNIGNGSVTSTATGVSAGTISITSADDDFKWSGTGSISSVDGAINITAQGVEIDGDLTSTGTGANAATITVVSTSDFEVDDIAVELSVDANITSVDGDINITGSGAGADGKGIRMFFGSAVTSTGTGANAADITLTGTGGTSGSSPYGVRIESDTFGSNDALVTSADGDITIVGTGGGDGTGSSAAGVFLDSTLGNTTKIEATGTGNISITGTAGNGTTNVDGIEMALSGGGANSIIANSGTITLRGVEGTGTGEGIDIDSGVLIGDGSMTGAITFTTDSIDLLGTVQTSGALLIQPDTASTSVGIANSSTGSLNLNDTELGNLTDGFSSITIGSATGTGDVDVHTVAFTDPTTIQSYGSGGSIGIDGALSVNGSNTLTLRAGGAIDLSSAGTVSVVDGNLTILANDNGAGSAITTGAQFHGLTLNDGDISTTGTGNIDITIRGGDTSMNNIGLQILNGGKIQSTSTGASAGTITVDATGGADAVGIFMNSSGSEITSVDGNIDVTASSANSDGMTMVSFPNITSTGTGANAANIVITATSTDTATFAEGFLMNTATIQATDGDISITATGGSGSSNNNGFRTIGTTTVTSATGDITITGATAGTGDSISHGEGTIGGATSSGTITLTGTGNIDLDSTVQGTGSFVVQPLNTSDSLGLGDSSTGSLTFDSGSAANISSFADYTFGYATGTGNIDIETISFGVPVVIQSWGAGGTMSVEGDLSTTGSNNLTLRTGGEIDITGGSTVSVVDGNLEIRGNADAVGDAIGSSGRGVHLTSSGTTVTTSGSGSITIIGNGGDNVGIDFGNGATISSTGTASNAGGITLTAESTSGAFNGFNMNPGTITSVNGNISITGTSNSTASNSTGVEIADTSTISATGTGDDAADITIVGTSGTGADGSADGIQLLGSASISTVDGDIMLTGTSLGTGSISSGVTHLSTGDIISTGTGANAGNITITGTGSSSGASNSAGLFYGQVNGSISSTDGDMTFILTAGTGGKGLEHFLGDIGSASTAGTITFRTDDEINVDSPARIRGSGALVFEPMTVSADIGVGTGSTGDLFLHGNTLDRITNGFSSITIGLATGTGAVDVEAAAFTDPVIIQSWGSGGTIDVDGALSTNGSNNLTLRAGQQVLISEGSVAIVDGDLEIRGNADGAGDAITSGVDIRGGVYLDSGDITTSGTGNITLVGVGGSASNENQFGIRLDNGGTINSTATGASAGTITLTGTGGASTGRDARGIHIRSSSSGIFSVDGNILLTGTGQTVTSAQSYNDGVSIVGDVTSTGTGANAATITIVGAGGNDGGSNETRGVFLQSGGSVNSVDGDITITGSFAGTASGSQSMRGVRINDGTINSTGTGANAANITITGTGGTTTGNSSGISMGTNASNNITSVDGNITLTGHVGSGAGNAIILSSGSLGIGGGSTTGDVTLSGTGNIDLDDTVQSTGTLTVVPVNVSDNFGIGDSSTGVLTFDTGSAPNLLSFSTATFGYATGTGNVDVETAVFSVPTIIQSWGSGGAFSVDGALSSTGSNNLTLRTGSGFNVNSGSSISVVNGDLEIRANADAVGDPIRTSGSITGMSHDGSTITTSGTGNITVIANGRNGPAMNMTSSAVLSSTSTGASAGTITITAISHEENADADDGFVMSNSSSITSVDGAISITGESEGASGSGTKHGVIIGGNGISSTGTGGNAATITLVGTSGTSGSGADDHRGVRLTSGVTSVDGNISITGTGRGDTQGSSGVVVSTTVSSTGTGDIAIIGTGSSDGSATLAHGIDIDSGGVTATSGAITLTGTAGTTGDAIESDVTIGGGSTTGAITLQSDSIIDLNAGVQSSGALAIEPITVSTTIGVGDSSTGSLFLDNTSLGNLTDGFSGITIGLTTGTGAMDVRANAFNDPITLQSWGSGGTVTVNGAVSTSGSDALTIRGGQAVDLQAGLTTVGGALTLRGNVDGAGDAITTGSNFIGIDLNGNTITSATGAIDVQGRGGTTGNSNYGVSMSTAGSTISSTGTGGSVGTVTVKGTGGSNSGAIGVFMSGSSITSVDGNIDLTGTGNATATGGGNLGLLVAGSQITSTGTGANAGTITINSTGGGGIAGNEGMLLASGASAASITSVDGDIDITANAGGATFASTHGLDFISGTISSTGTTSDAATITINGTGANSALFQSYGAKIQGGISSVIGNISVTGTAGSGGTNSSIGLFVGGTSGITSTGTGSNAATITLVGNGGDASGGSNYGTHLSGTTITSVDGAISITGTGGDSASNNYGVYIQSLGASGGISSTGTGANAATITINGTGGDGVNSNHGVYLSGEFAKVSSVEGDISFTPVGGANATGTDNYGMYLSDTAVVESTGTTMASAAQITINATGGEGTDDNHGLYLNAAGAEINTVAGVIDIDSTGNDNVTGSGNRGVYLLDGAKIQSTGSGTVGAITVDGIGGDGVNNNIGIHISGTGSEITSASGTATLNGTGRGSGTGNDGVVTNPGGQITVGGAGSLTVVGTGSQSGTSSNYGVRITHEGSKLAVVDGNLSVTGIGGGAGTGTNNIGIYIEDGGDIESTGTNTAAEVTIVGTGGTGSDSNRGVYTVDTGSNITTSTAKLTIEGQDGVGENSESVLLASEVEATNVAVEDAITIKGDNVKVVAEVDAGTKDVEFVIGQTKDGSLDLDATVVADEIVIEGTGSNDTLDLADSSTGGTWNLTGKGQGTVNDDVTFSGVENIKAGASNDNFVFSDGAGVTGVLDGGSGTNTADYSNYNSFVVFNESTNQYTGLGGAVNLASAELPVAPVIAIEQVSNNALLIDETAFTNLNATKQIFNFEPLEFAPEDFEISRSIDALDDVIDNSEDSLLDDIEFKLPSFKAERDEFSPSILEPQETEEAQLDTEESQEGLVEDPVKLSQK